MLRKLHTNPVIRYPAIKYFPDLKYKAEYYINYILTGLFRHFISRVYLKNCLWNSRKLQINFKKEFNFMKERENNLDNDRSIITNSQLFFRNLIRYEIIAKSGRNFDQTADHA